MRKKLQNKTIIRMALSFCAVFLLPVVTLYFLYTGNIVTAIGTEVEDMISNDLTASVRLIDSNIQTLNDTIKMFERGNGYQSYLTRGFSYNMSGVAANMQLESDISYIYLLNGTADDLFVLLPDADTVFSASGMHRSTSYFSKYYALPTQNAEDVLQELNCTENTVRCDENITTHRGTAETLSFIYPLPKNADGIGGTAVFCVQTQKFNAYFQPRSEDFQTKTFVFDANGQYLFSDCGADTLTTEVQTDYQNGSISGRLYKSDETGIEYVTIRRTSEFNGWQYMTLLPNNNALYRNMFEINRFFRLYLLLTIGIGILVIAGFLWMNYKPIFALREKAKHMVNTEKAEHEATDDLGTISNALTLLQNRNLSLNDTLSRSIHEIQSARLQRLLNNYYENIEEFNIDCEQIGLSFHGDNFYVSIILFPSMPEQESLLEEQLLQEFSPELETKCLAMPNQNKLVFIHCPRANFIDTEPFYSILGLLHDQLSCQATIGIGRLHPGAAIISKSYMQATNALDFRAVKGIGTVITYDEVLAHGADSPWYPSHELRRLANTLTAQNTVSRDKILAELIAKIKDPSTSLINARCIAFDLIKILMSNPDLKQDAAYSLPEYLMQVSQEKTKKNVVAAVEEVCMHIASSERIPSPPVQNAVVDEIIAYIQANYCRGDFSIQEIAEHFEMLPTNIGNYFKEQTGSGLLEYLISLRMKRAKELLHSTDMTVKEISMSVGYYNDSSFIRRFKQHEGVTPNEFRFKC